MIKTFPCLKLKSRAPIYNQCLLFSRHIWSVLGTGMVSLVFEMVVYHNVYLSHHVLSYFELLYWKSEKHWASTWGLDRKALGAALTGGLAEKHWGEGGLVRICNKLSCPLSLMVFKSTEIGMFSASSVLLHTRIYISHWI